MEKVIYTAMSGAEYALTAEQIHANNLANASTTGFRADFERVQAYPVTDSKNETRIMAQMTAGGINYAAGSMNRTDRPLDVAIRGDGFFTVQMADGKEAYTRDGEFSLNQSGQLTLNGYPVQGAGGPITVPEYRDIKIGEDGVISITPAGGGATQQIGQLKLVNPDKTQLTKNSSGFLQLSDGTTASTDSTIQVASGFLESSNVNPVDELIASLSLTRSFDLQVKLMQSSDKQAEDGNKLISNS